MPWRALKTRRQTLYSTRSCTRSQWSLSRGRPDTDARRPEWQRRRAAAFITRWSRFRAHCELFTDLPRTQQTLWGRVHISQTGRVNSATAWELKLMSACSSCFDRTQFNFTVVSSFLTSTKLGLSKLETSLYMYRTMWKVFRGISISWTFLTWLTSVTDGRTDILIANAALNYVARPKAKWVMMIVEDSYDIASVISSWNDDGRSYSLSQGCRGDSACLYFVQVYNCQCFFFVFFYTKA